MIIQAACRLLSRCLLEASHRQDLRRTRRVKSRQLSTSTSGSTQQPPGIPRALARLLTEFSLTMPAFDSSVRRKIACFNNFREFDATPDKTVLQHVPASECCYLLIQTIGVDAALDTVRYLLLRMAALGDATHNLPQLQLQSDAWAEYRSVLPRVG